jgi:hypothetical protein
MLKQRPEPQRNEAAANKLLARMEAERKQGTDHYRQLQC